MGLFNRKSKGSVDAESVTSKVSRTTSNLQSPPPTKAMNGISSFSSPLAINIPLPPPPDPSVDPAAYLRTVHAVRARSRIIHQRAKKNQLSHFDVDPSKFGETAAYLVSIIKRDFAPNYHTIPPHGRWQHFEVGGRQRIDQLLASWPSKIDAQERTRRLIDLFLVSVLLDAGAGNRWSYKSKESGRTYRRSEGLAVASLEMFKAGYFSGDPTEPYQVNAAGLNRLSVGQLGIGLQASEANPLAGLEGRSSLLANLGEALQNQEYFGHSSRPGNMLDYLLSHPSTQASSVPVILIPTLWTVLMDGLASIWPASRTQIGGLPLGDAWPCSSMPAPPQAQPWENIIPFHKLTQWLCYSLMGPMARLLNVQFVGVELLTGLPEYRNGGLLIDTGLITLKPADAKRGLDAYRHNAMVKGQPSMEVVPLFSTDDDVVVEWRAVTIGFLDELLVEVNRLLKLDGPDKLSLAQMLEAGSWKGGRELAEVSRPNTKQPPIMILSDGTLKRTTMETSKKIKQQKKKVLLMGKSGAGKSSMRSIIFSNHVAKDVRRLGATIDVDRKRVKFLGNLLLDIWDCGGQDAFMESYLTSQKSSFFDDVGVLIYVFDVESSDFSDGTHGNSDRDLQTYASIISALDEYSPNARIFTLVHKMDLVAAEYRNEVAKAKNAAILARSGRFTRTMGTYETSIWDETLYRAWGSIVNSLIPNLDIIKDGLKDLQKVTEAEEVVLFEQNTFLKVTSVGSEVPDENPIKERYERLSNIIKTFKNSLSGFTESNSSHQFDSFTIKCRKFNVIINRLTYNTYVLVVFPPGEAELQCARLNILSAKDEFARIESVAEGADDDFRIARGK
ncbi:MAG: hypothetical protein Q9182_006026 [Xanthomendoza sp. 2 TL-2023]